MSDELPILEGAAPQPEGLKEPALAYDYFKSMVSVSVATLGGILTLGETVFGERLSSMQVIMAALPLAISGMLALQGRPTSPRSGKALSRRSTVSERPFGSCLRSTVWVSASFWRS